MTQARRRAIRTLLQSALGAISAGVLGLIADSLGLKLDERLLATIAVVLSAIIAQVQNTLEDAGTIPTFLPGTDQ